MDTILVLDFGSQTAQLIARRVRELGVYTEILPGDADLSTVLDNNNGKNKGNSIRGIILSGSPESAYTSQGAMPDKRIYTCGLPLLGICYGLHRMTIDNGGKVAPLPKREFGAVRVTLRKNRVTFTAWMSHGDTITTLAPGFVELGTSAFGYPAVVTHKEKPWYGLQFHPEVTHCERGQEIFAGFVFAICHCRKQWTMKTYIETLKTDLNAKAKEEPVLLLISGGVDSAVAAALLLKALPCSNIHLMYMDTGLMRKNETVQVKAALQKLGAQHLHIIHCEDQFLGALKGVVDPEQKRKIIGDLFISIQEREVKRLNLPANYFLAQGTLYTDLIESGKGVGKKAHLIKSHHNVGSPLVDAKRKQGRILEPLDKLYKDEVRALGRLLGLDANIINRHPFPGPGLGVRILGEVTKEKCGILREADFIFIEELKKRALYDKIWQAFAVLLPVRSVGVAGDVRKYGWVLTLRAIVSTDGMTADVYPFLPKDLLEISTRITNTVKEIGRVTYDISSKPPATIEWE